MTAGVDRLSEEDVATVPNKPQSSHDILASRYSRSSALVYERLYGRGYQGPGGEETFLALAAKVALHPGCRVLDLGSGLGGDAFRIARRFAGEIVGLDVSPDMVGIAEERRKEVGEDAIRFAVGDVRDSPVVGRGNFDIVWTRDSLSYIPAADVGAVWGRLCASLRPGGRLLLTDYGRGTHAGAALLAEQMAARGAHMMTFDDYRDVARAAGFVDVDVEDWTPHLADSMAYGLRQLNELEDELPAALPPTETFDALRRRWDEKHRNTLSGNLIWTVVTARRG